MPVIGTLILTVAGVLPLAPLTVSVHEPPGLTPVTVTVALLVAVFVVPTDAVATPLHAVVPFVVNAPVKPVCDAVNVDDPVVLVSDTVAGEAATGACVCGVPVSVTVYGPGTMYPRGL